MASPDGDICLPELVGKYTEILRRVISQYKHDKALQKTMINGLFEMSSEYECPLFERSLDMLNDTNHADCDIIEYLGELYPQKR